jgi:hypothetical protein
MATQNIVGVHFKGGTIDRVKLESGQLLDRKLMVKQMQAGAVFMSKPRFPAQPTKISLVVQSGHEILTTNPAEAEDGDFVEGVPTF